MFAPANAQHATVQKVVRSALPRVKPVASIKTQETIDVCHSHKIKLESLNMTL